MVGAEQSKTTAVATAVSCEKKILTASDLLLYQMLTEVRDNLQKYINDALEEDSTVSPKKLSGMIVAIIAFNQALGCMEKVMQQYAVRGDAIHSASYSRFVSLCNAFSVFHPWHIPVLETRLAAFDAFIQRHQPRGHQVLDHSTKEIFATLRLFSYHLRQCLLRPTWFEFPFPDRVLNACIIQPYCWVASHKLVTTGLALAGVLTYFCLRK